jgi:hypothetical protein
MRFRRIGCGILGLAAVAGCSRQEATLCEPEARYSGARSAQPVQIPDDLSPPNESDAIRLPPDLGGATTVVTAGECLESPPSFFGETRPFSVSTDAEEPSRRSRREARRAERAGEPAEEAGEAPAESREQPPPESDDRVIDN